MNLPLLSKQKKMKTKIIKFIGALMNHSASINLYTGNDLDYWKYYYSISGRIGDKSYSIYITEAYSSSIGKAIEVDTESDVVNELIDRHIR